MVDNQHKKITGYRDLTEAEDIKHINEVKTMAVQCGRLCDDIDNIPGVDRRWAAIGKTTLQQGFMALIRSIAKPDTF
jgi:hypothetical protein